VADYPTYKFVTHFLSPRGEKAIEYQLTTLTEIMSKRKIKQAWGEGEEEGMMIFFHTPKNKQTNKQKQKIKRNKKKEGRKRRENHFPPPPPPSSSSSSVSCFRVS